MSLGTQDVLRWSQGKDYTIDTSVSPSARLRVSVFLCDCTKQVNACNMCSLYECHPLSSRVGKHIHNWLWWFWFKQADTCALSLCKLSLTRQHLVDINICVDTNTKGTRSVEDKETTRISKTFALQPARFSIHTREKGTDSEPWSPGALRLTPSTAHKMSPTRIPLWSAAELLSCNWERRKRRRGEEG